MNSKVAVRTHDGLCEAWEVRPYREGKYPGVLMYMDAFGVRESLLEIAQRIADQGFVVLVPNLFYRNKSHPLFDYPEKFDKKELSEKILPAAKPWMTALTPDALLRDAEGYLNHLLSHSNVKGTQVGIVGYCMGGAHAVRTAAAYPDRVGAVVSLHGGKLASDEATSPHLSLKDIKAKLYFGHADGDQSMPASMIQKLEEALKESQNEYRSEVYEGAHHGFTQKDVPAYDEEASEKSLAMTIETFRRLA